MKMHHDLAKGGHNRRYQESEYQFFRDGGMTHEAACERVGLDPELFTFCLHKRQVRAS